MSVTIRHATSADVPVIVSLLLQMQDEVGEFDISANVTTQAVAEGLADNVHWFLFYDSQSDVPFGICYLQAVHIYLRLKKRYYIGGFYIKPEKRGQGRFRQIYAALKDWVKAHNGTQIFAHIHQDNNKSQNAFMAMGMEKTEYRLYADYWEDEAS